MFWAPEKPHNSLPPLPPAQNLESRAVLKACINARTARAELKQAAGLIPNQTHAHQYDPFAYPPLMG